MIVGCGGEERSTRPAGSSQQTAAETVSQVEDAARAQGAVLTLADLGQEWEQYDLSEDPVVAAEFDCPRYDDADLAVNARAPGDVFSGGPPSLLVAGKPFMRGSRVVTSSATVFQTEGQAETAFARIVGTLQAEPVLRCFFNADTVRKGPRMVRTDGFRFPTHRVPVLAEDTYFHQYRTRIEKKGGFVWLDVVVMRDERALGFAIFSSLELPGVSPPPITDEFVTLTARVMANRLPP